jgi:CRP-like cAMP-binding protein
MHGISMHTDHQHDQNDQNAGTGALTQAAWRPGEEVHFLDNWESLDGLERALSRGVLARLPPQTLQRLMPRLREVAVGRGEVVFDQGRPADGFYLIKAGHAEVCRIGAGGRSYRLSLKFPGDAFGEGALMLGRPRSAMVRMLTDGVLLHASSEDFTTLVRPHLIREVTLSEARARVAEGARWLDLRDDDFAAEPSTGVVKVPISLLRLKRAALPRDAGYVVFAADRATAELGCYLLSECGLAACYLAAPPAEPEGATEAGSDGAGGAPPAGVRQELELRERALEAAFAQRLATAQAQWQTERASLLDEMARRDALATAEIASLQQQLAAANAGLERAMRERTVTGADGQEAVA